MKQLLVMMCVMLLATGYVRAGEDDERVAASRATVKEFMQSLKQELQKGMQDGGPVNALGVCNMTAPGIANTYSARHGWSVGRTSLRVRNLDNAPDIWEQAVLQEFERRKHAGENPAELEYHESLEVDGKPVFRYMKAIPTAELCVVCHGSDIDPYVDARIRELYPDDQARGFKPGDIRGAFTITQPLNEQRE
jgi:hypothetical protein